MKFILTLMLLLVYRIPLLQAQALAQEADVRKIFETVVKEVREYTAPHVEVMVSPETTKIDLQRFHFRDPQYHTLHPSQYKLKDDPAWSDFLLSVDTARVRNYPLKTGGKYWFGKHGKPKNGQARKTLFFSPVIFSEDRQRAVFTLRQWSDPLAASGVVMFMEKRESGEWEMVEDLLLWIS